MASTLLRIGILGDFDARMRSHIATNEALRHAADSLRLSVAANWLPTQSLADSTQALGGQDAILAAPGSPYRSLEGMLAGIQFARCQEIPFLGTCGGFQYMLIEYARHVLGLAGADTEENGPCESPVITPVACPVPNRQPGAPKLSGLIPLTLQPGTLLAQIYGATLVEEEYFCNFEVNPRYLPRFERAGVAFSARGIRREVRAAEIAAHPFFIATLFQPQLSSREGRPHLVFAAFLQAACTYRQSASIRTACPL